MEENKSTLLAEREDTQYGRYLTFPVGEESFAVAISCVSEIIGIYPITPLPDVPAHVKGIINLRGKIVPVIDIRLKFKKPAIPYDERTCVIVMETNGLFAGLIVDSVSEVLTIPDEQIVAPPSYGANEQNRYISGIGTADDKVTLILDADELLNEE
ncbi:MAG TPA: chemotaxis protein CheW [Clostridia bacterium]|nr:chemotaxis protein CheW [Clostridia bacterium]